MRHTDDSIIYAKGETELVLMLQTVTEELSLVGLNLNNANTNLNSARTKKKITIETTYGTKTYSNFME